MTNREIIDVLEQLSPPKGALDWDNIGLLVGHEGGESNVVYLALDATDQVIDRAVHRKAGMILTHHPLIFSGLKRINDQDFMGRRILNLVENKVACYAMHTNFDVWVMARLAADRMGLKSREVLEVTGVENDGIREVPVGIGCTGYLEKSMTLEDCARAVKKAFGIPSVRFFGDKSQIIRKVSICPGSGKGMTQMAVRQGAQALITGDIGHHDGIDAVDQGLCIIDAGHHGIEHIFVAFMKEYLEKNLEGVEIIADSDEPPFTVV